jgi:hypothetical protein
MCLHAQEDDMTERFCMNDEMIAHVISYHNTLTRAAIPSQKKEHDSCHLFLLQLPLSLTSFA